MYQGPSDLRDAPPVPASHIGAAPDAAARLALDRLRKALTAHTAGVRLDPARMLQVLWSAPAPAGREAERPFALGWLHWLAGDFAASEPFLADAICFARRQDGAPRLAEAAYWHARVRALLGRTDAISEYETVLKETRGAPQAAAWLVDLLWRAGRVDRAEQVWKSVRGNKKVTACDEGPLLEARVLLRRGEAAPAERLLSEAAPASGVVQVERRLLLAWTFTTLKQYDRAKEQFEEAKEGPYPAAALANWSVMLEKRRTGQPAGPDEAGRPPSLAALLRGHEAFRNGRTDDAVTALHEAAAQPAAQPFARYALACLGQDDPDALLACQPGLFLALRCRAWAALDRFRKRQATPAELLDALQRAASAGWKNPAAAHFRRLAQTLQLRQPTADDVHLLTAEQPGDPAARRNLVRGGVETAVRGLPVQTALELLLEWSTAEVLDDDLRSLLSRHLLRALLVRRGDETVSHSTDAVLAAVDRLSPGDGTAALVRTWLQPDSPALTLPAGADASPVVRLWQAARTLAEGGAIDEARREDVRGLRSQGRLRAAARALLLLEAARRGDASVVAALLDETDAWRGFRNGPPCFVTDAVAAVVAAQPNHPGWRRSLGRWIQVWGVAALGPRAAMLAAQAGLSPPAGGVVEPPPGTPPAAWYLHQAARALGRDEIEALGYVRRAVKADPDLTTVTDADAVRAALPELERRARARALADAGRPDEAAPTVTAALLVDMVDLIGALPNGADLLDAAVEGDLLAVRSGLKAMTERPYSEFPPRLAHHLALMETRAADALDGADRGEDAEPRRRAAWRMWLCFLANPELPAGADPAQARAVLLDWLLAAHRRRIADLLARNAVDAARRHWNLVQDLPDTAAGIDAALGRDLALRAAHFRDELATDYLLATREAMRYGAIPEGLRADYGKGLSGLLRLLSLDRDNVRLLTAVVEICDDWFLDLYNAADGRGLTDTVERFIQFATQLARLVEGRPGDLAARAALADYWKFRGFTAGDPIHKVELYREALGFNPGNDNVRKLLQDLDEPADAPPQPDREKDEGGAE
jgi:hypothetical protein